MIGRLCTTDEAREKNRNSIERLWRLWTRRDGAIWKVHGESKHSRRSFEEFGETLLEKPIHDDVMLSKGERARLELEINQYQRRIEKGKFVNAFEDYMFTPTYQAPQAVQRATMYETPEFAPSLFRNIIG